MVQKADFPHTIHKQIMHFIIHLRWHYQVFILSGGYILGGYFSTDIDWPTFLMQFTNVHLLLFGGATAYNSYYDKDEGPIGGLKHPPPMRYWMMPASLILQLAGLLWALLAGYLFASIYLLSAIFFWLYSSPRFRWKGTPLRSLLAIGISTGTNSLLLGYLAAGNEALNHTVLTGALGVGMIILSLYPVSQLYQIDDDLKRGDKTFAIKFGFVGVIRFFEVAFGGGLLLVGLALVAIDKRAGFAFIFVGVIVGFWIYYRFKSLPVDSGDYNRVMHIKYVTSLAFVSFIVALLIYRHVF